MRQPGAPDRTELVEELLQCLAVTPRRGPHQPTGILIDHARQIPVSFAGDISSILMRRSPASTSRPANPSAATRSMIALTCRHDVRINSPTTVFAVRAASHTHTHPQTPVSPALPGEPTAPKRPPPHAAGTSPAALRPAQTPSSTHDPTLATDGSRHPDHTQDIAARTDRTGPGHPSSAAPR